MSVFVRFDPLPSDGLSALWPARLKYPPATRALSSSCLGGWDLQTAGVRLYLRWRQQWEGQNHLTVVLDVPRSQRWQTRPNFNQEIVLPVSLVMCEGLFGHSGGVDRMSRLAAELDVMSRSQEQNGEADSSRGNCLSPPRDAANFW